MRPVPRIGPVTCLAGRRYSPGETGRRENRSRGTVADHVDRRGRPAAMVRPSDHRAPASRHVTVSTSFGPVERRTVADEIRERIADSIRSGELQAGERLPRRAPAVRAVPRRPDLGARGHPGPASPSGYLERRGNRPVRGRAAPRGRPRRRRPQAHRPRAVRDPPGDRAAARRARLRAGHARAAGPRSSTWRPASGRAWPSTTSAASTGRSTPPSPTPAATRCSTSCTARCSHSLFESEAFASLLFARPNRKRGVGPRRRAPAASTRPSPPPSPPGIRWPCVAAAEEHLSDVEERMLKRLV